MSVRTRSVARRMAAAAGTMAVLQGLLVAPADATTDELTWKPCHLIATGWEQTDKLTECTLVMVPLDYAKPKGRKIQLAVSRIKATDRAHRRGALVINAGGPGGHGVDQPWSVTRSAMGDVGKVYDLIGFDPRGVQYSDKISCPELLALEPPPDDLPRELRARLSSHSHAQTMRVCAKKDPDFARSLTTETNARDVDSIRTALGEKKISFFGKSWGSALGASYRSLFDGNVDRMLLDSVLAPGQSVEGAEDAAAAEQNRFRMFAAWVAERDKVYHFGATESAAFQALAAVQAQQSDDGRTRLDRVMQAGMAGWPEAADTFAGLRDGTTVTSRTEEPGSPGYSGRDEVGDFLFMLSAVNCNDTPQGRDFDAVWKRAEKIEADHPQAPRFTVQDFGNETQFARCVDWPYDAQPVRLAKGKSALQLVGHEYETNTPFRMGEEDEADDRRLVADRRGRQARLTGEDSLCRQGREVLREREDVRLLMPRSVR